MSDRRHCLMNLSQMQLLAEIAEGIQLWQERFPDRPLLSPYVSQFLNSVVLCPPQVFAIGRVVVCQVHQMVGQGGHAGEVVHVDERVRRGHEIVVSVVIFT